MVLPQILWYKDKTLKHLKMKYYTLEDFEKVNKIDAHFHANSPSLKFLNFMRSKKFGLFSINTDVEGHSYPSIEDQLKVSHIHKSEGTLTYAFAATFSLNGWEDPDWSKKAIDHLEYSFSQGATAVKVWKNIGMDYVDKEGKYIQIDDEKLTPVIDFIESKGFPLLGHIGEPKNCWLPLDEMTVNNDKEYFKNHPEYHMYLHPEQPKYQEIIDARNGMLDKHPNLHYIGCHLGSQEWSVDVLAEMFEKYPNYAVDLAHRMGHVQYQSKTDHKKVRDFLIKYQDRIMYGTDTEVFTDDDEKAMEEIVMKVWLQDWKYFVTSLDMEVEQVNGSFKGLELPKEVVDKIYYLNAKRWLPGL